jgi:hypothetical protein
MTQPAGERTVSRPIAGEIVVASRIVDYLSSGLYESPAACLKELINNAFDADARLVELFIKPDADRIIVADDGHGMDSADFKRNFSKISESFKREDSEVTVNSRPKIGKIGIGFIAANEICDVMQVVSTKLGSTEKIDIEINFAAMREPIEDRRRDGDEIAKADYAGVVTEAPADQHYTRIFLKRVRGPARDLLTGARNVGNPESLYGLGPKSISDRLRSGELRSWDDLDFYSRTMLEIALNVPVKYADGWSTSKHKRSLKEFESAVEALDFTVVLDGTELRKPTAFPSTTTSFIKKFDYQGSEVSFKSYFYVQHGVVKPQDLNGALVRIRNSAIGRYESGFLGFPNSIGTLFQRWISAEVWADDRLEAAMNIDRKTLRVTHPAYLELVENVHIQLKKVLDETRERLYEAPSRSHRADRARSTAQEVRTTLAQSKSLTSHEIAKIVPNEISEKQALRKYSVSEVVTLALSLAAEVMTKEQLKSFTRRLIAAVFPK